MKPVEAVGGIDMSGHSKWAQIRRSKGVNDARRGQLFTRLGREIVVAVREGGGGDPNANFRLRMAVQHARDANMPHTEGAGSHAEATTDVRRARCRTRRGTRTRTASR